MVDSVRVQQTDMSAGTEVACDFIWSNETAVDTVRVQVTDIFLVINQLNAQNLVL